MKKIKVICSLIIGMSLTYGTISCTQTPSERVTPIEVPEVTDDLTDNDNEEEKVVEKPARSEGFYERLLETFCQDYYNDCFSKTSYKSNSLRITDINIVRRETNLDEVTVHGIHSSGGLRGHNDIKFTAMITEKENDYFEVFFLKDKYVLGKVIGEESGTRNMSYTEN